MKLQSLEISFSTIQPIIIINNTNWNSLPIVNLTRWKLNSNYLGLPKYITILKSFIGIRIKDYSFKSNLPDNKK